MRDLRLSERMWLEVATKRRVVVTGMGVISPIGTGLEEFWRNLVAGKSGIRRITSFNVDDYPCKLAAEADFDPLDYLDRREARKMDRFIQFAVVCSRMAMEDAEVGNAFVPERSGVILGSGIGGVGTFAREQEVLLKRGPGRVSPFFIPALIANMASGYVSIDLGLKGPISTVVTACASGTNAIGDAFKVIQRGDADLMITGGTEAPILPIALAGFCAMKALSTRNEIGPRACRPFDKQRDGFIMGEGAGILVLESLEHALARNARIYGEIVGYGTSSDAYHITAPAPRGEGAKRAIQAALADAGVDPFEIDYVNAHGTSTPANDRTETQALKDALGEEQARRIMMSSTKSMIGHLLGAAGATEMIATLLTVYNQIVPPTINYEEPDPECDLDYVPNQARSAKIEVALKNSFGFGGQNACLVVKSYKD